MKNQKRSNWGFRTLVSLAVFAVVALLAGPAMADVPVSITQQGRILDGDEPLTGSQTLEFELYDDASGGAVLWSGQVNADLGDDGVYSVTLGDAGNPIDATVLQDGEAYLELTAGGEEFSPRLQLTSVPFASMAQSAEVAQTVVDGGVTSDALASGAVTSDALSSGAVTSDTVDSVEWDKITNVPSEVTEGGGETYSAGTGLDLNNNVFSVEPSYFNDNYLRANTDITIGGNTTIEGGALVENNLMVEGGASVDNDLYVDGEIVVDANNSSDWAYLYFRGTESGDDGSPRIYHNDNFDRFYLQGAEHFRVGRNEDEPMHLEVRGDAQFDGDVEADGDFITDSRADVGVGIGNGLHYDDNAARLYYNTGSTELRFSDSSFEINHLQSYLDTTIDGNFNVTGSKNFIQPHPTDPAQQVNYIAQEGGEAGVYWRGTANTEDGRAVIDLPEEFSTVVSDTEDLTTTITPQGQWAPLYVESESPRRLVVAVDDSFDVGDVEFDFHVQGVRGGLEGVGGFEENVNFQPSNYEVTEDMELHEKPQPHIKDLMIRNGTLNPDGTVNVETAQKMGWDL